MKENIRFFQWNMSDVREFRNQYGKMDMKFTLYGINILDYLDLYKKHTFVNQESYKLDHIAHVELDKKKVRLLRVWFIAQIISTELLKVPCI